jgi:hypothetical protein
MSNHKIRLCQNFKIWSQNPKSIFIPKLKIGFRNQCLLFLSNLVSRPKNSNSAPSIWSKSKVSAQIENFSSYKILIFIRYCIKTIMKTLTFQKDVGLKPTARLIALYLRQRKHRTRTVAPPRRRLGRMEKVTVRSKKVTRETRKVSVEHRFLVCQTWHRL